MIYETIYAETLCTVFWDAVHILLRVSHNAAVDIGNINHESLTYAYIRRVIYRTA